MLAYLATKDQFLRDAPTIADEIQSAVRNQLGIKIGTASSEYQSWQNSLGNAMFHVLNSPMVPGNAGVAVEYRLQGRRERIDMMISGYGPSGSETIAIVELKQWATVQPSLLTDHVVTWLGGANRDERHPSYQAWSYSTLMENFYEVVEADPIVMTPCAYVHNSVDFGVLRDSKMGELLNRAPVFLKGEFEQLRAFLAENLSRGDEGATLRKLDASIIKPSKKLTDALQSMLDGNDEFVLIDEQKTAFETILEAVRSVPKGAHKSIIVKGGPGTGKSVIAINAMARLLGDGMNVRYVTKNGAPRAVYKQRLQKHSKKAEVSNLFMSSDSFYDVARDSYDVLLVDEAHRLVKNSGPFRNLGDNQIAEVIAATRVSVFFIDDSQQVTWRDIGSTTSIADWAGILGTPIESMELNAQFRCAGSNAYLEWVDEVLQITSGTPVDLSATDYEVSMAPTPSALRDEVAQRAAEGATSRLLAGYCWDWVSKRRPAEFDIVFPGTDFSMRWNLTKDGQAWIDAPTGGNEVGCIHTCQGLEGGFMGVIIGNDLLVRNGKVMTNPAARAKTDQSLRGWKAAVKKDPEGTLAKADVLIRNTYRALLTRGMSGTMIYCTDSETHEYFQAAIDRAKGNRSG